MIIYRVEDDDGDGPYQRKKRGKTLLTYVIHRGGTDDNRHPQLRGFYRDRPPSPEQYCGFRLMRDLYIWFNNAERRRLHNLGFSVAHYRVPPHFVDLHQVGQILFYRSQATLIKRIPVKFKRKRHEPGNSDLVAPQTLSIGCALNLKRLLENGKPVAGVCDALQPALVTNIGAAIGGDDGRASPLAD